MPDYPAAPDGLTWQRSAAAEAGEDAVEIAVLPDARGVFVRTTNSAGEGAAPLYYTAAEWAAFTAGVRAGEFDAP